MRASVLSFASGTLLAAMAIGCGPSNYIALKPDRAAKIATTRVQATIMQEEVDAAVQVSNVTPGYVPGGILAGAIGGLVAGLINAGVNSHRTGEANKLVEPVRKEVA